MRLTCRFLSEKQHFCVRMSHKVFFQFSILSISNYFLWHLIVSSFSYFPEFSSFLRTLFGGGMFNQSHTSRAIDPVSGNAEYLFPLCKSCKSLLAQFCSDSFIRIYCSRFPFTVLLVEIFLFIDLQFCLLLFLFL